MMETIQSIDNALIIKVKKPPLPIISIYIFILIISGVIPIASTVSVLTMGNGLHFGLLLAYLIFWGSGYFMLRIILWNIYGQEILTLDNTKIYYVADYKFFKGGRQEIEIKDLVTEIFYGDEPTKLVGRLRLINDATTIETVLLANVNELKEFEERIKVLQTRN